MFYKRIIPYILSLVLLGASILYVSDREKPSAEKTAAVNDMITAVKPPEEIRGVWVTYMTLDVENESDKEAAFKAKIDGIIDDMEGANLNTMVVQVRPFSDAIYPSRYYPWSHILTGTQGEDPGFDPLKYIVQAAHEHAIAVHAWINPYRISTGDTPSELSGDNPAVKNADMTVEVNGSLYLNPADEKAIKLITDGVREIIEKYDVDAVQFDDYFYPPDCGDFDAEDYEAYCESTDSPLPLEEFRRDNVTRMVQSVYRAVHQTKDNVMFGISPQGNLGNNEGLYADVEKWCSEGGYIDYICPQIYFSLDNPALTFEDGLRDWLDMEKHEGLSLYVGIPAYKAGTDADSGTWLDNDEILKTEIGITRESDADGFMLYSYDSFHNEDNAEEVENVVRYLNTSV
ncbi:MAG: family 10 glycosylhydrolase [Ruminococcus sp.]|uniref:glycoside hydrolase family 10 protein n=1 Tax=Ruminococcus sp. TaxID=41978 RepID=UPI002872F8A8|nr:family 10 glycosylhydrolase [Ruminococcus sp.]MBQ3284057.1 family 10 glycosylhydrolase [Ruminococcus sp.]